LELFSHIERAWSNPEASPKTVSISQTKSLAMHMASLPPSLALQAFFFPIDLE
jgi:hypothetical protein